MNAITAPLRELAEFEEGQALLKKPGACVGFTGCVDSQKLHMAYGLSDGFRYKIIVTFSDLKAREIFEDYQFYDREVTWYPAKDLIFYQADIHGNQLVTERMKALRKIIEGKPQTVITTFAALMSPQVPLEEIAASVIHIDADSSLNEGELARKLAEMGYEKNYQVDDRDSFPSGAELLISLISRKKILTVLSCGERKWNPSGALTFSASAVWKS